nr:immunoglobulin heavy chain junction region [Macaca mulatta]MPN83883.1 immunoglobulin heavy chain junction region [Macaca mulatta]MPN83913.1 immunoglobulin heavy chain junction region [Macaca mulatta]MPN83951.1 immunoglobulin heavy chain junction region [Macaca mulatta]MPN83957.1 immunoglobulin heavy chain junction region [Macaca mulatta]
CARDSDITAAGRFNSLDVW